METYRIYDRQLDIKERAILVDGKLYTESDCCVAHDEMRYDLTPATAGKWSEKIRKAWGF